MLQGRPQILGFVCFSSPNTHSALGGAKKSLAGITGDEGQFPFSFIGGRGSSAPFPAVGEAGDVTLGLWRNGSSFGTGKLCRLPSDSDVDRYVIVILFSSHD
jgi:hypothetical protein